MTRIGVRVLLVLAIAATMSCDRATKHIAARTLVGVPSQSFLADTVRLQYVENTGGFLSLGVLLAIILWAIHTVNPTQVGLICRM